MSIDVTAPSETNKSTIIRISGRFDFSVSSNFNNVVSRIPSENSGVVVVCMADANHIDSVAIGVLLVARDVIRRKGGVIKLRIKERSSIDKVFSVMKVDKLFEVERI